MGFKRTTAVRNAGFEGDLRLTPAQRFVLHLLAEHAHDDPGGLAWPTNETLASESSLTRGTVNAAVGRLRELGLIEAVGIRNRRVAYRLNMEMIEGLRRPATVRQVSGSREEVSDPPPRSVPESHTQPQGNPRKEESPLPPADAGTSGTLFAVPDLPKGHGGTEETFDEFWKIYPRHVAKAPALKAWVKATRRTKPEVLLTSLRAQAAHLTSENERGFCPYPATWLNAERWLDEVPKASGDDEYRWW